MLWGKYWELVHDQWMRCRESQRTDGSDLLVVVGLESGSQGEVGRLLLLLFLQLGLLVIADRCRAEVRHLVRTDHAQILHSSHSSPRMAVLMMMRIIVLIAAMVRVARATRSSCSLISALSPG